MGQRDVSHHGHVDLPSGTGTGLEYGVGERSAATLLPPGGGESATDQKGNES